MIGEKSGNWAASWAASCANQMFLKVVLRRTTRNPPGLSTSNLNGSALNGSAIAGAMLAGESVIHAFPFAESQGLGSPLRIDAHVPQTCAGAFAANPGNPAQPSAQLFAAELEH